MALVPVRVRLPLLMLYVLVSLPQWPTRNWPLTVTVPPVWSITAVMPGMEGQFSPMKTLGAVSEAVS